MEALSPLRAAQDQAVIASCLAVAMASAGEDFTLAPHTAPAQASSSSSSPPPPWPERRELLARAQAMRVEAAHQCQVAQAMRIENEERIRAMREVVDDAR